MKNVFLKTVGDGKVAYRVMFGKVIEDCIWEGEKYIDVPLFSKVVEKELSYVRKIEVEAFSVEGIPFKIGVEMTIFFNPNMMWLCNEYKNLVEDALNDVKRNASRIFAEKLSLLKFRDIVSLINIDGVSKSYAAGFNDLTGYGYETSRIKQKVEDFLAGIIKDKDNDVLNKIVIKLCSFEIVCRKNKNAKGYIEKRNLGLADIVNARFSAKLETMYSVVDFPIAMSKRAVIRDEVIAEVLKDYTEEVLIVFNYADVDYRREMLKVLRDARFEASLVGVEFFYRILKKCLPSDIKKPCF